jgi:histidine decarboxylase
MTSIRPPGQRDLDGLLAAARRHRRYDIGFPGATDLTFPELGDWLTGQLLNNIGDPYDPGHGRNHTKAIERDVIDIVADLLHAPPERWGYVTGGASEANEHALHQAAQQFPNLIVYTSTAAHYSIGKAATKLQLSFVTVAAHPTGEIDIDALEVALKARRRRPVMIVATAGTTMTEAIDDVAAITTLCDRLGIRRRRIHVDAALSGIPLAVLPTPGQPGCDFRAGATSMVISGHKFLSTLMPCAILVYTQPPDRPTGRVAYTGSSDTTLTGSRSGHTPLLLWTALTRVGVDGHRARAAAARDLADYAQRRLTEIGWPAWRHDHAFTVVLAPPPAAVTAKWVLPGDGESAHLITMPGISRDQIDEFIRDLELSGHVAQHSGTTSGTVVDLPGQRLMAATARPPGRRRGSLR